MLFVIFPTVAFAQLEGNPENWCRNGFFPRESVNYLIAKVKIKKGERAYFYSDDDGCPNGNNCRAKSYLVTNNEVIVSRNFGDYSCVWYQPQKGAETAGWIATKNLEFLKNSTQILSNDWLGAWVYYSNDIEIGKAKKSGFLKVSGNAIWKGLGDNIHTGEMDGLAKPLGNLLSIGEKETDEFACKVRLYRVGKYLIASDNLNCGGVNVTFSGVYLRQKKAK